MESIARGALALRDKHADIGLAVSVNNVHWITVYFPATLARPEWIYSAHAGRYNPSLEDP